MSERAAVTIVGIGADGWDGLTETARAELRQAPMIVGSSRQLALLPDLGVRQQPLAVAAAVPARRPGGRTTRACACWPAATRCCTGSARPSPAASGPAGCGCCRAVSSVALACARLGWAEHEVDVVSLVSRPVEVVVPAVQPGGRVLVLCRDGGTPAALASLLADRGWGGSRVTVLEHLGGEAEQVSGPVAAAALGAAAMATWRWWPWSAGQARDARRAAAGSRPAGRRVRA